MPDHCTKCNSFGTEISDIQVQETSPSGAITFRTVRCRSCDFLSTREIPVEEAAFDLTVLIWRSWNENRIFKSFLLDKLLVIISHIRGNMRHGYNSNQEGVM